MMKKLLCCILCILMLWYVVPVGMLSVNAQEIEPKESVVPDESIGDIVFSWECSSIEGASYGSWAYGATAEDGYITLRPTYTDAGYAAYYMWTGNIKEEGSLENVYTIEYGKTYVLNFKAMGEAGKEVHYDFKDGSIGMNGVYTFETTGEWEDVWSAPMTVTVDHELDLPPDDSSIHNGYPLRLYLNPNGNSSSSSYACIDDIVIYELGEEIVEPEPELPEEPEVEAPEKCIWLQGNRTEDRPGNYAAIYQWSGKDEDGNYNIEAGKQYIMEFDVKGTAGESIIYDFADAQVPGAKGSYVFQSNNWEHVESPIFTMDKPYEDFAPGDGNVIYGYCYRIYTIADTADTVFADRFYVGNIVIYEVNEDGSKCDVAWSCNWNIDTSLYPSVLGAGGALEAMNAWATSFGDIIVDVPRDHIYTSSCDESCDTCGAIRTVIHDYTPATCTKAKTCKYCGTTIGVALGHTHTYICDESCNTCGEIRTATHDYTPATCTKAITCKYCGTTIGVALGHDYSEEWTIDKKATCTTAGSKSHHCTACDVKENATVIPALGHDFSDAWTVDKKATTSAAGSKSKHCTRCDAKTSVTTIPKISSVKLSTTSYNYNGYVKKPTVTIKDVKGNKLESGVDYTVSYASGRKLPGKYKVTVTFKGEYSGTKSLYFTIKPKAPSKLTVSSRSTSTIKLSWPKVTGATGYKVYRYNTSTGEYKLIKTLTTSTSLNVTGLKSATNYRYAVRAYKKASDGTIILSARKVINTATRPVAPFINSINSPSKGKVTLMWSDVVRESGYQIYYSNTKTGTYKLYDMTSLNDVFETYSGFKSGRTYYFKVRAFKTVNGNRIYSSFSAVKGIKIK